jgi:hypothetical protein
MAFTKIVGAGIHTLSNIHSHNVNSSGIITATKFVGPIEGNVTAVDGVFSGNLTVQGTTTTLDTNLIDVDKIEVTTESTNVAVAVTHNGSGDLIRLYDGTSQVVTVDDEGNVTLSKNNPTISLSDSNNNPDYQIGNINGALRFQDTTNNETRLIVNTTGNIGIGTVTPGAILDVLTSMGRIKFNNSGSIGSRIDFANADGTVRSSIHNYGGSNEILVLNSSGSIQFNIANSTKINLASNGKLGVGTDNPDEILTLADPGIGNVVSLRIVDPTASTYGAHFSFYDTPNEVRIGGVSNGVKRAVIRIDRDAPSDVLTVTSAGKVGIGTDTVNTTQDKALTVYGTTGGELQLRAANFGGGGSGEGANLTYSYGSLFLTNNATNGDIHFSTKKSGESTTEKMRITESGLVGINSTAPAGAQLVVKNSVVIS